MLFDPKNPLAETGERIERALSLVAERHSKINDALVSAFDRVHQDFQLPEIDFSGLARRMAVAAAKMGAAGWTFPMHATPKEAIDLVAEAEGSDYDTVFVRYYEEFGYAPLKESLMDKAGLEPWSELIDQAIAAHEAGHDAIAVTALLTVFEGRLAAASNATGTSAEKLVARLKAKTMLNDSVYGAVLVSIEEFVKVLYARSDFTAAPPARLNRHWKVHGRDAAQSSRADVLRLLQAIDTIRD